MAGEPAARGVSGGGAGSAASSLSGAGGAAMSAAVTRGVSRDEMFESKPEKKGKQKLKRWLLISGVPGASLLAPLALPTMFAAVTLVGTAVPKGWVMFWQVIAIVLWVTAVAGVLGVVGG